MGKLHLLIASFLILVTTPVVASHLEALEKTDGNLCGFCHTAQTTELLISTHGNLKLDSEHTKPVILALEKMEEQALEKSNCKDCLARHLSKEMNKLEELGKEFSLKAIIADLERTLLEKTLKELAGPVGPLPKKEDTGEIIQLSDADFLVTEKIPSSSSLTDDHHEAPRCYSLRRALADLNFFKKGMFKNLDHLGNGTPVGYGNLYLEALRTRVNLSCWNRI